MKKCKECGTIVNMFCQKCDIVEITKMKSYESKMKQKASIASLPSFHTAYDLAEYEQSSNKINDFHAETHTYNGFN